MSLEDAEQYANTMINLTTQARGVVRDLDPKVRYLSNQSIYYFNLYNMNIFLTYLIVSLCV